MNEVARVHQGEDCANIVERTRWRACEHGPNTVFTFIDRDDRETPLSWAELDRRARAVASSLQAQGAPGERALLLIPPGLDYVAVIMGCFYAGVSAVPTYPPRGKRALPRVTSIMKDARAAFALTTSAHLRELSALAGDAPELQEPHWLAVEDLHRGNEEDWQEPVFRDDTLAMLQYTSGSTTAPRGVMLTHGTLRHNLRMIGDLLETSTKTRAVFWLPPYHDMGLIGGILGSLYCGAETVLMAPLTFLQRPFRWLEAASRTGANLTGGPNFAYDLCTRRIKDEQRRTLDLSCIDLAFVGAEPIHKDTLDRFAEAFAPCGFRREALYPCYGLAETTLIVTGSRLGTGPQVCRVRKRALEQDRVEIAESPGDDALELVGCGRAPKGLVIRIVDPEARVACPPNQVGEVWVSAESVAEGYWDQPDATAEAFEAHTAPTGEGPFLRTGDLGFLRGEELFITGRLKDLIIVNGRNHYPQDIELTGQQGHESVIPGGCAAFSVDGSGQEQLVVLAELDRRILRGNGRGASPSTETPARDRRAGLETVAKALRQAVAESHDLMVHQVALIKAGAILRTSSGKIQRQACREKFLEGSLEVLYQG